MTEYEITERIRRLKELLATQTRDINQREADRMETIRELRAYRTPLREIADLTKVNHQTVTNWIKKGKS